MAKKKKKKVIPLKTRMKRAAKAAHRALSIYVRTTFHEKYGKCPLCNERPIQALFHILRSKYVRILRYDERNVIASCHKCNWLEYRNPDPSRAWYIRAYGVERYLQLCDEGKNPWEFTMDEYLKIEAKFTSMLKDWEEAKANPPKPFSSLPFADNLKPEDGKGAGDEFGGEDFPS